MLLPLVEIEHHSFVVGLELSIYGCASQVEHCGYFVSEDKSIDAFGLVCMLGTGLD